MSCIVLVDYDKTFLDLSKEWLSDSETNALTATGEMPGDEQRQTWFDSLPQRSDYLIWGVQYEGKPIGACGLKHVTQNDAEYWGYIGEKTLWGKGLGGGYLSTIQKIAKELNLKTIYLRVLKFNTRAIKLYIKYGFKIDREDPEYYFMSLLL